MCLVVFTLCLVVFSLCLVVFSVCLGVFRARVKIHGPRSACLGLCLVFICVQTQRGCRHELCLAVFRVVFACV